MANDERRLADNLWDLRDDACDHPERWEGITVEDVFQRLAKLVEEAEDRGEPVDWWGVRTDMLAWRADDGRV
jgi:hypothetical protein